MRIAWLDLLFSWPPRGGADVDAWHVLRELAAQGAVVKLFGVRIDAAGERGLFEPEALPFPAECLVVTEAAFTPTHITQHLQEAVADFAPDVVVVGDAFFLKPHLLQAFTEYPTCARFYAHELLCHRDILRYKDGAPCPNHYLESPEICRACAYDHLKPKLRSGVQDAWSREYAVTQAFEPGYYDRLHAALSETDRVIVSNPGMEAAISGYCKATAVIPGGIDPDSFTATPLPENNPKIIYMPGRAEDPVKGFDVVVHACERLRARHDAIVLRAVMPWKPGLPDWVECLPWMPFEDLVEQYQQADVCVVPSRWEEPFGLVAVEAMAAGRPVCASDIGGLKTIIQHDETGLLFPPGDGDALAQRLDRLLQDPALSQRLAMAGRARVETTYSWRNIVELQYIPLFNQLCRHSR